MKRFLGAFFAGVWMMTGVAHGAEPEVLFYRNAEIVLQDRPFCRNGKWMVSLRDLERLTGTQAKEEENCIILQKAVTQGSDAESAVRAKAYFQEEGILLEGADGSVQKLDGGEFYLDDTLYVRCREFAEALGYEVRWCRWGEKDLIEIIGKEMPEITLDVEYDKEKKQLRGSILNKEPQAFLFGYDFILEQMTEHGWERVKEAEPQFIDDVGFPIYATRTEDNMDGITPVARRVYADLPAGQYRMGIPFSYRYHLQNVYGNPWDEYFEKGEAEKLGWDFYYSTHWGEPDFYFEGAGLSTTNGEKDTHYMLYGEFEVK